MKYCYNIEKFKTFSPRKAKEILPEHFQLKTEENNYYLIITTSKAVDGEVFIEVQRECDRIYFLTGEQLNPRFEWKRNDEGLTTHLNDIKSDARIVKSLPDDIGRQKWNLALSIQLRLWQLSKLSDLPIAAKINLLFQIIEISFPNTRDKTDYPDYNDITNPPDPKKESLFLRNLASHGKGMVGDLQIKNYCRFLNITETLHDPTDTNFIKALKSRLKIVEQEARNIIKLQLA